LWLAGAEQVLTAVYQLLVSQGVPRTQVHALFAEPGRLAARVLREDDARERSLARAARVLQVWCEDSTYFDKTGTPLPLREWGSEPSMEALLRKAAPGCDANAVKDVLRARSAVVTEGVWRLKSDSTMLTIPPHEINGQRIRRLIAGLLTTWQHNAEHAGTSSGNMERTAFATELPDSYLNAFRDHAKQQIGPVMESMAKWLMDKEGLGGGREPRSEVGLSTFVYVVPQTAKTRAKASRGKTARRRPPTSGSGVPVGARLSVKKGPPKKRR
jgi:hypothetical protein